jgi:hypothetical protein
MDHTVVSLRVAECFKEIIRIFLFEGDGGSRCHDIQKSRGLQPRQRVGLTTLWMPRMGLLTLQKRKAARMILLTMLHGCMVYELH